MKKDRQIPSDTSIPDPLNSFAKRISEENNIAVNDGVTAKELLTSLMPVHKQLGCLPLISSSEKCNEMRNVSVDFDVGDKKIEEAFTKACVCNDTEERSEEESDTRSYTSATDELELSFDGKWLRSFFKIPLKTAMKEIVSKKPRDPVGYLGFWLLNHRRCHERKQRRSEKDNELHYLRSLVEEHESTEEISVGTAGEEEEEQTRDWNFKYYETARTSGNK